MSLEGHKTAGLRAHTGISPMKRKVEDSGAPDSKQKNNFSSSKVEAPLHEVNSKRGLYGLYVKKGAYLIG